MIEEVTIRGRKYRGILGCPSANTPWKITVSDKPGCWQTWGKYEFPSAAEAVWKDLRDQAEEPGFVRDYAAAILKQNWGKTL